MALLEICCYSVECAVTAQKHGADRIELCAAPKEGGLTPSYGVLRSARQAVTIPVHPIIRPRGGDFCYTAGEFSAMLDDIALVRDLGFPGLVTGLLDEDGNIVYRPTGELVIDGNDVDAILAGFEQIRQWRGRSGKPSARASPRSIGCGAPVVVSSSSNTARPSTPLPKATSGR